MMAQYRKTGSTGQRFGGAAWLQPGMAFAIFSCVFLFASPAWADGSDGSHLLVRLQPHTDIQKLVSDFDTTSDGYVDGMNIYSLSVPNGVDESVFEKNLLADTRVLYVESNDTVGSQGVDGTQIHFAFDRTPKPGTYLTQSAYQQVNVGTTHTLSTGVGITVAILDTGVNSSHTALTGHLGVGYNAIHSSLPPDDIPDGLTNDTVGHGTMIAGLVALLAPDANIMPIRVLDGDGSGTTLSVVAGIHYAVQHGAQVINMSFGGTNPSQALTDALNEAQQAGVVLVAAAGNDGVNAAQYPAAMSNVIAVASVEKDDIKSNYSNFGSYVAVVAPGTHIRSTFSTGGYATSTGTSFSAPFVSIEAVLILSTQPYMPAEAVAYWICSTSHTVDSVNQSYQNLLGAGLIDIQQGVIGGAGSGGDYWGGGFGG